MEMQMHDLGAASGEKEAEMSNQRTAEKPFLTSTECWTKTLRAGWNRTEYRVEKNKDSYILHGPRGACYGLIRHKTQPEMLFVINLRTFGEVRGMGWFTDADGELREVIAIA